MITSDTVYLREAERHYGKSYNRWKRDNGKREYHDHGSCIPEWNSNSELCYLKGINEIAACRVCVVELEGKEKLITSCNNVAKEGMVIHTNSPKVRRHRRTTVELILSQHDCECVTCSRSGNCSLQTVANDLNIIDIPFKMEIERQPWNKEFH